ncbi:MAG: hypothetical protein ACJ748_13820 [Flavisolibacter sp.]
MFNPFYLFTTTLLEKLVERGKMFFIRQTFIRAKEPFDETIKGYFLISHYDNITTAMDHFGAISYDANRFLYEWHNSEHKKRLELAASQPQGYKIYSTVFKPDWEKHITDRMKDKMRKYVKELGWNPNRSDSVVTNYELQFGELYIRLKYGRREAKVKFEEIENIY